MENYPSGVDMSTVYPKFRPEGLEACGCEYAGQTYANGEDF